MGKIKKIAFIGMGKMGRPMSLNLLKAGFSLAVYARHPQQAAQVQAAGAVLFDTPAAAVAGADAVITIVGGPQDVRELYLGEQGILQAARRGTCLMDMTSSSPELARELFAKGSAAGLRVLDIPVTGGDAGAADGTLTLLCGGREEDLAAVKDVLEVLGSNIVYEGPAGAGQQAKLVNQIMVAGSLAGMCEGFAFARALGLSPEKVLRSVASGAAASRSLELYGRRIVEGDRMPGGALRYLVKDLKNALREIEHHRLDLNVTAAVLHNYAQMCEEGDGKLGTQALAWFYEQHLKPHERG